MVFLEKTSLATPRVVGEYAFFASIVLARALLKVVQADSCTKKKN